jgi:hypothetical protein
MTATEIERPEKKKVWLYKLSEHKTDSYVEEKIVCIGPRGCRILQSFIQKHPKGFIFKPSDTLEEKGLLRTNRKRLRPRDKKRQRRVISDRYDSHSYFNAIKSGFRLLAAANGYKPAEGRMKMTREHAIRAKIEWWHPHQLRHTRGTETKRRFNSESSSAQLGHGLKVNEIYSERNLELAMKVAQQTG